MSPPNAELVAACVVATACIVAVAAGTSPALRMEVEATGVIDPSRTPVAQRPQAGFERGLTFESLDGEVK
jgi:hypothetical protein